MYNNIILAGGWLAGRSFVGLNDDNRPESWRGKSFISYQNKKLLQQEENQRVDSLEETKITENKEVEFTQFFIRLTLNMALQDKEVRFFFFL